MKEMNEFVYKNIVHGSTSLKLNVKDCMQVWVGSLQRNREILKGKEYGWMRWGLNKRLIDCIEKKDKLSVRKERSRIAWLGIEKISTRWRSRKWFWIASKTGIERKSNRILKFIFHSKYYAISMNARQTEQPHLI